MKLRNGLCLILLLTGCANRLQVLDTAKMVNQVESQKETASFTYAPKFITLSIQPVNINEPCLTQFGTMDSMNRPTIRWYGTCESGHAMGLGLTSVELNGEKVYTVEEYTADGRDIAYSYYPENQKNTYAGIQDKNLNSGINSELYNDSGYTSLVRSINYWDQNSGLSAQSATNLANGVTINTLGYAKSGIAYRIMLFNDNTLNLVARILILNKGNAVLDASKLQNGQILAVQNGQTYDASGIIPYIEQQFAGFERLMAKATADSGTGLAKTRELASRICSKRNKSDDVNAFCSYKPFSNYSAEFLRSSAWYRSQRETRLVQIQQNQMMAIQQRQIQQQNYAALNQSLNDLNATAQQMQHNTASNTQSYSAPTPVVPTFGNQTSIYTCQGVSSWTYCRQQR